MFDADWEHWQRMAHGFARHWGCSPSDADDVAQQAVLAAMKRGPAALAAGWFFVVTRRLAARLRANQTRERRRETFARLSAPLTCDETILMSEIQRRAVLNPRERSLLEHLLKGDSQSGIARAHAWGVSSVGVRVKRLIHKLRLTAAASDSSQNPAGTRNG